MSEVLSGIQAGLYFTGTVRSINEDGTMVVGFNVAGANALEQQVTIPIPNSWLGTKGQFAGGYPSIGQTVKIVQGHTGKNWHCLGYEPDRAGLPTSVRNELSNDRYLIKTIGPHSFYVEPEEIRLGTSVNSMTVSSKTRSSTFSQDLNFTDSNRHISGEVKRYLKNDTISDVNDFSLNSILYEKSLTPIGLDPEAATNTLNNNSGDNTARNPAFAESRNVYYEFSDKYNFSNYQLEHDDYINGTTTSFFNFNQNSKNKNRAVALSLTLENPNHLIETIVGTAVDSFGNVLDINRSSLPVGKIDSLSLINNQDKSKAYKGILRELRKSIAYHFEINSRKDLNGELNVPDPENKDDYARSRSKFFIDIDKEGQFKINVPASSETGNIPLLTRYENFSVIKSKKSKENDQILPTSFIKPETGETDIYLENFGAETKIKLTSGIGELDGYAAPLDRFTDKPITYGVAHHDINIACREFLEDSAYKAAGMKLINFDKDNRLNTLWTPLKKIVSDTINVSGDDANAGGRSGMINLDGFISINVGANTIDRQSVWLDTAGGIVQTIGRDKNNISHAAQFDGDVFWQIGGAGIGANYDSRFSDQFSAYRNGTLDIRVLVNGQIAIFRIGPDGIYIVSPGTLNIVSQQDIILKSNANILMEATNIVMYAESTKRLVERHPANKRIT
jgi:hypothetical protein